MGLQELPIPFEAAVFLGTEDARQSPPVLTLQAALDKLDPGGYEALAAARLGGVLGVVFGRVGLGAREVATCSLATGILGVLPNKGGVAIRLRLGASWLCLVAAHLNAHAVNVERRNQDQAQLLEGLRFNAAPFLPESHNTLIFLGDLNYRLELEDGEVRRLIGLGDWAALLRGDQLRRQQALGKCFVGFQEALPLFPPTYKYEKQSANYSRQEGRVPSWTDRILWKGELEVPPQPDYKTHDLFMSDHRPVSLRAEVRVRHVDSEQRTSLITQLLRDLDLAAARERPRVEVTPSELTFGPLHVASSLPPEASLRLVNKGDHEATWRLVAVRPKDSEESECSWLSVHPTRGVLPPGGVAQLQVRALLPLGAHLPAHTLEAAIVLRLLGGQDFFVVASAERAPSCFGHSLRRLCAPPSVRTAWPASLRAPPELLLLLDWLVKNALQTKQLFQDVAPPTEIESARLLLESATPLPPSLSPHAGAELLLRFLGSIQPPLLPLSWLSTLPSALPPGPPSPSLLHGLGEPELTTLLLLLRFLRLVAQHASSNLSSPQLLVKVFAPVLGGPGEGRFRRSLETLLLGLLCSERSLPLRMAPARDLSTATGEFEMM